MIIGLYLINNNFPFPAWNVVVCFNGSCQVKKNQKIREKPGLIRQHPPTPYLIFWNMKTTQKTQHF